MNMQHFTINNMYHTIKSYKIAEECDFISGRLNRKDTSTSHVFGILQYSKGALY